MKKNVMMRVASIMLVLVLMSSSVISGTFAKYVTADSGSDNARVAKFGVTVEIEDESSFAAKYATHDTVHYDGAFSVEAKNGTDKVVAPGTSSTNLGSDVTFTITGTPEVATYLTISFDAISDIYLGAGTYDDPTTAAAGTFDVGAEGYHPVKFTLKSNKGVDITGKTLAELETAFNALSKQYAPNVPLDETFTLTWEWAYGTFSGVTYEDRCDTMLGNLAATPDAGIDYSTDLEYSLSITVTQVD